MKVLVTGSAGFLAGYVVTQLLEQGHTVVGIDNYSKYGPVKKNYDHHPRYQFILGDAKDVRLLESAMKGCEHVIAAAAMVGGIAYFHRFAYDLLAENERLTAALFDVAIQAHQKGSLKKVTLISSSMVFEGSTHFPSREGDEKVSAPPQSSYGFQKLACEYFAKAAFQQYGLPSTILRPFNCVGLGEVPSLQPSLSLNHVVPDLIQKAWKNGPQGPLEILGSGEQIRHFTHGSDLARGIVNSLENPKALNEDFNLSTNESTSVRNLAEKIWSQMYPHSPCRLQFIEGFPHDVQVRIPSTEKAQALLQFQTQFSIERSLQEIIPWVCSRL